MNTYTKIYITSAVLWVIVAEITAWGCINHWHSPFLFVNAQIFLALGSVWLFIGLMAGFAGELFFD